MAIVAAFVTPVVLFERHQSPLPRSAALFHSDIGGALGRLALTVLALCAYYGVIALIAFVTQLGTVGTDPALPIAITIDVIVSLLFVPAEMAGIVCLLVTYAQLRAPYGGLTTRQLDVEASASPGM